MAAGIGVLVQRLPRSRDRVLVVAHLVGSRARDPWFRPTALRAMFEDLRVPEPGNISEELSRLRKDGLARTRSTRLWSVTPLGDEAVRQLVGALDVTEVEAELRDEGVAMFDHVEHPLIPPELAPLRFRSAIDRVLSVSPFERNVFLMSRFPPGGDVEHPISAAIEELRSRLRERGLTLHVASDRQADDQVLGNVGAHLWACKYGVALLEATDDVRAPNQLNDNVLIEVGAMLITGRRCALLKDVSAPALPSDFVAEIYKEIDLSDPASAGVAANDWVQNDLGL